MSQFNKYIKIAQEMINEVEGKKVKNTPQEMLEKKVKNTPQEMLEKLKGYIKSDKIVFYDKNLGVDDLRLGLKYDKNLGVDDPRLDLKNDKNLGVDDPRLDLKKTKIGIYSDVDILDVLKNSEIVKDGESYGLKFTKPYDFTIGDSGMDFFPPAEEDDDGEIIENEIASGHEDRILPIDDDVFL
jgi:hypothetical protein